MSIKFPANRKEVADRAKTDVQSQLPSSNPFLKNSYLGAIITGFAGRVYDFYLQLIELIKQIFPHTATGDFLLRWGSYVGLSRNPASAASGLITVTGTAGSVLPVSSEFRSSDGLTFETQASATVTANTINISSMTRSGSTVTANCSADHNFASGMDVVIAGADQSEYNGTQTISVTDGDSFTFEIDSTPVSPATGTITASADCVAVLVESQEAGILTNLASGSQLTLSSPVAGIDNTAIVQYGEVSGGTDIESDADLRVRVIDRYANPVSLFNVAAIKAKAREVPGVTRVWVEEITPYIGAVTIYFTRDNETNIIPSAADVNNVKAKILEIKPAHVDEDEVIVSAPTAVPVDFTFMSLSPNTASMQAAIRASLEVLFEEGTTVGSDLLEVAYESAIYQTVDVENGDLVTSFALSAPSGDISISDGEIPTLGTITFA